jgi:hypothetical protein
MPLGNLKDTFWGHYRHPEVDFYINLIHCERGKEHSFHFDTAAIKEELGDIPHLSDVIEYITKFIKEYKIPTWRMSDEDTCRP